MRSRSHSKHSKTATLVIYYEEEDNRLPNNFYQPPPALRRERREPTELRTIRLDLPHFYGKDDAEVYLD